MGMGKQKSTPMKLELKLQPAGRKTERSKITHVFRHAIAGIVSYVSSHESASDAVRATGRRESALWSNYDAGLTTSIPNAAGEHFHLIQNDSLDLAHQEAIRRSWVKEVYDRLSLKTLTTLPVETLRVMYDQLP